MAKVCLFVKKLSPQHVVLADMGLALPPGALAAS